MYWKFESGVNGCHLAMHCGPGGACGHGGGCACGGPGQLCSSRERRCSVGTANVRNEIVKFKTAATRIHAMFVYIVFYMMYSTEKNM